MTCFAISCCVTLFVVGTEMLRAEAPSTLEAQPAKVEASTFFVDAAAANRAAAEWVLLHYGVVTVETGDHEAKRYVAVEHLPMEPFAVTEVNLYGQEFDESELDRLTGLSRLEVLDLSRTLLSEHGLGIAGEIPNLKKLYLRGNRLSADAFRRLKNGNAIENCSVTANYDFNDQSLSTIAEVMPNLTRFSCSSTAVTPEAAHHFQRLPKLEYLALKKLEWSKNDIKALQTSLPKCRIKT